MLYNALTQMKAKNAGPGKYADGQGLWLVKRSKEAGKWTLRLVINRKRREMGLGRWPDVSISEARDRAADARKAVREGLDPITERSKHSLAPKTVTLEEAARGCFEAKRVELKNANARKRWLGLLEGHVLPKIGSLPVEEIDQHQIKATLEPIWHSKAETARKSLGHIGQTLKYAAALGLDVDLQAPAKARALMGKQRHQTTHIPAMPYAEAPEFYRWLCSFDHTAALALRFLMLTVARTTEVRLASASEIDGDVWVLSPERTKTGREHRVPLTQEAISVLSIARSKSENEFFFPALRGKPISDMAMSSFMKREGYEARPHGFRATFRTWCEEQTEAAFEVKEAALGHQVDAGVVGAYQRSDRLEKRRELMRQWSAWLLPKASKQA
ncbi:tyrosine-type recombinase/integrase [Parerythrobacter aestuarii]|uniref:tyrosine-type recombinase/integrase n=1 Tax=Parerythrobacter aestuarii TaxID=3020909 RepID=UPI0024DE7DF0|nr:site-specific integrase [Parerythrobacter aestuarii]